MADTSVLRKNMVQHQIAARGVSDERVLDAMRAVPREAFMPEELGGVRLRGHAAADRGGADDLAALHRRPHDRAPSSRGRMTGCSRSAPAPGTPPRCCPASSAHVYTVERHEPLVDLARAPLRGRSGYDNVEVLHGDGSLGWPEHAPYDAIIVTAGGPHVPQAAARPARRRRPHGDSDRLRVRACSSSSG